MTHLIKLLSIIFCLYLWAALFGAIHYFTSAEAVLLSGSRFAGWQVFRHRQFVQEPSPPRGRRLPRALVEARECDDGPTA